MNITITHAFLYVALVLAKVRAEVYTNKNGVTFQYKINFRNKCRSQNGRFAILPRMTMSQCVEGCGLRRSCAALNYRRGGSICELFSVAEEGPNWEGGCVFLPASDIYVKENPCGTCAEGKVCDTSSHICIYKECKIPTVPKNGKILGNNYMIGGRIKYQCNGVVTSVVCLASGQWSGEANCSAVCPAPPSIINGHFVQAFPNSTTATVYCDPGYKSNVPNINCTPEGVWGTARCDQIVCPPPPPISNGHFVQTSPNSTSATVYCDPGYKANVPNINCAPEGVWGTARCDQIVCPPPPQISNGHFVQTFPNSTTATVHCDPGYKANVPNINCTPEGVWGTARCDQIVCPPPPPISNGHFVQAFPNSTTATVHCDPGYKANVLNINCTPEGVWGIARCDMIAHIGCYVVGSSYLYQGFRNKTKDDIPCQRWDSQSPHGHGQTDGSRYPEGSVGAAGNFCRDPDLTGAPWCYTVDIDIRWRSCGVPSC